MTSITWWNRLEPRPRSPDIERALAAEIRDPVWMLTRQWQVGEFQGEDAASPAWVELVTRSRAVDAWCPTVEGCPTPYNLDVGPIEATFQHEHLDEADLSLAAELGLLFEEILLAASTGPQLPEVQRLILRLRAAKPLTDPLAEEPHWRPHDGASEGFLRVCAGRTLDGMLLLTDVGRFGPDAVNVFPGFLWSGSDQALVQGVLAQFTSAARTYLPEAAPRTPAAWRSDSMCYRPEVSSGELTLSVTPDRDGFCDWWSFEILRGRDELSGGAVATRRMQPAHIRFRGMPNARWWDFESSATDFGAIQTDQRDLARMALMEFMLVQSNDWFMVPFQMHVGTLCQIDRLRVHDVFGGTTDVPRADRIGVGENNNWTMFSTSSKGGLGQFFHLPASAGATRQDGPVVEEVQFLRDEMANMAWAIEHTVPTQIGEPFDRRGRADQRASAAATPTGEVPLRWVLQSEVPAFWYPLLPVRVGVGGEGTVMLELGHSVLAAETELERTVPAGRMIQPEGRERTPAWREEEIPRPGLRLLRRVVRSRWIDGSTHVWFLRSAQVGVGEGPSGLRFDVAEMQQKPEEE